MNLKKTFIKKMLIIVPLLIFIALTIFSMIIIKNFQTNFEEKQYSQMVSLSERIGTQVYEETMKSLSSILSIRENFINLETDEKKFDEYAKRIINMPNVHDLSISDEYIISKVYTKDLKYNVVGKDFTKDFFTTVHQSQFEDKDGPVLIGPYYINDNQQVIAVVIPVFKSKKMDKIDNIISLSIYFPDAYNQIDFDEIEKQQFSYKIWYVNPSTNEIQNVFESETKIHTPPKLNTTTFTKKYFTSSWFYTFEPRVNFYDTSFFYILFFILFFFILLITYACFVIIKDFKTADTIKTLKYQVRLSEIQEGTIFGLSNLVENRDNDTGQHVRRTSEYVTLLAKLAYEEGFYKDVLSPKYIELLGQAAALHDIGKIVIPDSILKKPGKLTEEEFEEIKKHTTEGSKIVKNIVASVQSSDFTNAAIEIATSHHEKWNGTGYPSGISGVTIPLSARFMAIADVFDALTTTRCYKEPYSFESAVDIIKKEKGSHFDPVITDIFLKNKDKFREILEHYYN